MTSSSIRVLLIEDNPSDANLVEEFLAEAGNSTFALAQSNRLATGLERLTREGADVVLLDLSLPDSDGLATLDRVLALEPAAPVLILTGLQEDELALEAVRRGAHDYLIKGRLTSRGISRALRYSVERFRTCKQLTEQSEQLRLLSEQLPAILWTTGRDLRFTSALGTDLKQLGLKPGAIVGLELRDYFQTDDPEFPPLTAHRRALQGEAVSCVFDWMERSFRVRVEPFRHGSQIVGTVGVALDITGEREIAEEFRIAHEIQQRLLPRTMPVLPGFEIGGCARFAEATGGDFFDCIALPDGTTGAAIGDASGHGFGPALLAAVVHASLRTQALTGLPIDPATMLATCNRLLCEGSQDDQFVTLLLVALDPQTRSYRYSNAGHPPGWILDVAGNIKASLDATGCPLGSFATETYSTPPATPLEPGDLLVCVTDGVLESLSPDDMLFGRERMLETVQAHRWQSAQEIAEALCAASLEFCKGEQTDDLTAAVVKVVES